MRKLKKYAPTRFMAKDSHYDKDAADYAVPFIESLKHTKGTWAGKPFELIDWQEQIVRDVFGTLKPNGYRQFNTAYVEIPKKQGKQVSLSALIPTPAGFTTMGNIAVGDTVFDERGKPCRVVAKSAIDYDEQAYRITFKDGEIIEAGEHHQWYGEYTHGKRKRCVFTTGQLYRMPKDSNSFRFRIPIAGCIDTAEASLPVEPYLYGYWLGNGNAAKPEITIGLNDVAAVLRNIITDTKVMSIWKNTGDSLVVRVPALRPILLRSFHDTVTIELPIIKKGANGGEVTALQRLLRSRGFKGKNGGALALDGDFGSNTDYALRLFQRSAGLTVDGVCGKATWTAILRG